MKNFKMLLFGSAIILLTIACGASAQINTESDAPTQAPAQPVQASEQEVEPASGGWRDDIPIPDVVTHFVSTDDEATCNTADDLQTTADFYRDEMPKYGWILDSDTASSLSVNFVFSKDDETAHIGLTSSGVDSTLIGINISSQSSGESVKATTEPAEPTEAFAEPTAVPAEPTAVPPEPTAVPAEPTAAPPEPTAAPPASDNWRDDIPLPADASNIIRDPNEISFNTAGSLPVTADFYRTEMPKYGWTLTSDTSTAVAVNLVFAKGGEEATVGLSVFGLVTDKTSVGIVVN